MKLIDTVKIAFSNVFINRNRSILTALSVTIGVSSVFVVSFIGTTGGNYIENEMKKLGLQGISIYPNKEGGYQALYSEDAELLERKFKEIDVAMPVVIDYASYKLNKIGSEAIFFGIGREADEVYNVKILHGRAPIMSEINAKANVAVIDDELAKKAYKRTNVVGKKIVLKISDKSDDFTIIGVIKSQKDGINKFFGNNMPDFIYIPYTTLNNMRKNDELSQISIRCDENYVSDGIKYAEYLSKVKNVKNAYVAENVSDTMDEAKMIINVITIILSTIAAISLCVAGLGIMNSMFSNGIERRREIGICIALGATEKDIMTEFIFESIIIAISGGIFGAIIGFGIIKVISLILKLEIVMNINILLITEIVCLVCAIVFSVIPAKKASSLEPVKALRRTS